MDSSLPVSPATLCSHKLFYPSFHPHSPSLPLIPVTVKKTWIEKLKLRVKLGKIDVRFLNFPLLWLVVLWPFNLWF